MTKLLAPFFSMLSLLTLTHTANAQIISIEGSHDISCHTQHTNLQPPQEIVTNSFAQTVPVTTFGPSSAQCSREDDIFDASVLVDSNWIADSESVIGSVTEDGHINYPGSINLDTRPGFQSFVLADFIVDLDAADTPFRLTIDWDMLPFTTTGDGSGNSTFVVTFGDRQSINHYQLVAGCSNEPCGDPDFGATGSLVIQNASRLDSLRVRVTLSGYGSTTGGNSCDGLTCHFGSVLSQSFINYELLVGDAALPPDTDTDGVADSIDNCTLVANPDQRDTNGDGFGNFCDPDLNNDGVVNFLDIAAWVLLFNTACGDVDEDLNGDGACNFGDFAIIPGFFQLPPGPSAVTE